MALPVALPSISSAELIDYILKLHKSPTTLVICESRESFLETLRVDIRRTKCDDQSDSLEKNEFLHPFLIPTIHLLASSKTVHLAFTPTLSHVRAFLANFTPRGEDGSSPSIYHKPGFRIPMLAIFNLTAVHRPTSEYSAQGLSRTVAIAVEAAKHAGMKLVLAESCYENESENTTIQDPWKAQVPLLNGTIRSGESGKIWAGRTVDIGKVIGRWCRLVGLDEEFIG